MIYIPKNGSLRERICMLIDERGPLDHGSIAGNFKGERYNKVKCAVASLRDAGALEYSEETAAYALSGPLKKHYGQMADEPAPAYEGEVVSGKFTKPFQPLKSLPWAVHADKLRDVSFKTVTGNLHTAGYRV